MKKIIVLIIAILITSSFLALPVCAEELRPYGVFDSESLLTSYDKDILETKIADIYEKYSYCVLIVTTDNLDGKTPAAYADDFYEKAGYGGRDGILFLVSINSRDYYFSTGGNAQWAFTDYGIDYLGENIQPLLSDGDYSGACDEFVTLSEKFIIEYKNGKPYDTNNRYRNPDDYIMYEIIFLVISIIAAVIVTSIMKSKMASPKENKFASEYIKKDSFVLTDSRDMFMYSTVRKVPKPKQSSGGGSSTHRSSGGFSHGGGGGKF